MGQLGILPVALVAVSFITFAISYIIGVANGDIPAAFPYISDTGSKRPESCIFGLFLNFAVFLSISTMYIRYKGVQALAGTLIDNRWVRRLNKGSIGSGIISCVGCSVVANFQEGTVVEDVHLIGAAFTFIFGILYCFLQSALSFQMYPEFNGRRICIVRLAISVVSIASAMLTVISAGYALHQWNQTSHQHTKIRWSSKDPGYAAHIVSTSGEWVTALSFFCFFLTYVREFNKFDLDVKIRPLVSHLDQNPVSFEDATERTRLLI